MNIKTFLKGGNFSEYMHIIVLIRDHSRLLVPLGGGCPSRIISRFGFREIECVSVYETKLRIQVKGMLEDVDEEKTDRSCCSCFWCDLEAFHAGSWYCKNPGVSVFDLPVDFKKCFRLKEEENV